MSDKTAQNVHDLVEDTVSKGSELVDQARTVVEDGVAGAKAVISDLDDNTEAAVEAAREFAVETFDKVYGAYKRNPVQVIALGSFAVAVVTALAALVVKRR